MGIAEANRVERAGSHPYASAPRGRRVLILVVDDDHDSADGIAMLLGHWNHEVRVAYDASEALRVFRDMRPDLVLLDIGLPGMDGCELATALRGEAHHAFLVALTGCTDRKTAIDAGFEEHFPKPVDPDALRDLIAKM